MGNSQAKESRSGAGYQADYPESSPRNRNRMSRGDMAFLSIGSASPRDRNRQREDAPFEHRETRAEREARRLERERATRAKIRERSLKEEHVDGGYLVTLGTYTGTEDFSKPVVRQLQIERRLAPFWRGLNDWSENWAEHQLIAAARGLPIPAADAPPDPELVPQPLPESSSTNLQNLTVPLGPRTLSAASDRSGSGANSGVASPSAGAASKIKPRAKAIAMALTGGSRDSSSTDLARQEAALPPDPFVNGQALEVYLYKDAADCPICFLSYPPYLNRTRCCDQPICTECFVQIKRADPHLPEHHPDGEARDPNQGLNPEDPPELLISEPSACPYCQQPEFGVTYEPPHFRRGLVYSMTATSVGSSTPMSSQSSLHSTLSPTQPHRPGRKRGHSLSANAPNVITTDRIRPDWATKLAAARQHQARRAAAATALHTAAFLVGSSDQRSILRSGRFGRRNTGSGSEGALTPSRSGLILTGNEDGSSPNRERNPDGHQRTRMDELEDMMFMEAVRLSLAAEEERKKKEAKAMRKEAKKQEKAEQKALKKQGKDIYGNSGGASGSSLSLNLGRKRGNSVASNLRVEATVQGAAQATSENTIAEGSAGLSASSNDSKGKGVNRETPESQPESPMASSPPVASPSGRTTSHLRHISNASSLGSSLADTPSGSYTGPGFHADGTRVAGAGDDSDRENANESMFNFRSLAELVGVDIENGQRTDGEGTEQTQSQEKDTSARPLSRVSEEDKDTDAIFPVDEVDAVTTETKPPQQAPSGEKSMEAEKPSVTLATEETLTEDPAKLQSLSRTEDKVIDNAPAAEQARPSITE